MSEEQPKQTHSERMAALREQAENVKGAIDTLVNCKEEGGMKQVSYWVGQSSRLLSALCQECLGEELIQAIKEREGRIIT